MSDEPNKPNDDLELAAFERGFISGYSAALFEQTCLRVSEGGASPTEDDARTWKRDAQASFDKSRILRG
jgi:hypothetical protein